MEGGEEYHGERVRGEGRGSHVDGDAAIDSAFVRDSDGEGFAVREVTRGGKAGASTAEVGGGERFDAELRGEDARERVELVRVGASHQNAAVPQESRNRMIHAGNGGGRERLEATAQRSVRVVHDGVVRGVGSVAPALRPLLCAIDDDHIAVRRDDHVAHGARDWHVLHGPLRVGGQGVYAPACIRRAVLRIGVAVGAGSGSAAHDDLAVRERGI